MAFPHIVATSLCPAPVQQHLLNGVSIGNAEASGALDLHLRDWRVAAESDKIKNIYIHIELITKTVGRNVNGKFSVHK